MVNELLTNAYKYAFEGKKEGQVCVELSRTGEQGYRLIVQDDGIGMPEGMDPGSGGSLGLRLVGMLTRQLNGDLHFSSDQGTRIMINFKEATA